MSCFKCDKQIEKACKYWAGCCHFREKSILSREEEDKIKGSIFNTTFVFYIYPFERYTITITPDEKTVLEKEAKKSDLSLKIIPKKIIYNQKKDTFHIIDYSLDHDVCLFLDKDNRCSIYESRPDICKRFPDIKESDEFEKVKLLIKRKNITKPTLSLKQVIKLFDYRSDA